MEEGIFLHFFERKSILNVSYNILTLNSFLDKALKKGETGDVSKRDTLRAINVSQNDASP